MQERQRIASLVLTGGMTVSAAARECGVSRPTAQLWVKRAREQGVENLEIPTTRPHRFRGAAGVEVTEKVLSLRAEHPYWGAAKLHAILWPDFKEAPVCVRTVERVLRRAGLTKPVAPLPPLQRFERSGCNELWQMDFKGLEACWGYRPLSLLDDRSRYCVGLVPLQNRGTESVWATLWALFGEYGLPLEILCDNGDCWGNTGEGPTPLEARLWRLDVKMIHGRVRHPQTQGKVERFHRTLETEGAGLLRQLDLRAAQESCEHLRQHYNWQRPHEALGQEKPGVVYHSSERKRPAKLPAVQVRPGAHLRKVAETGLLSFRGQQYRAGRGLGGESVEIREEESGWSLFYSNHRIGPLRQREVNKPSTHTRRSRGSLESLIGGG